MSGMPPEMVKEALRTGGPADELMKELWKTNWHAGYVPQLHQDAVQKLIYKGQPKDRRDLSRSQRPVWLHGEDAKAEQTFRAMRTWHYCGQASGRAREAMGDMEGGGGRQLRWCGAS